MDTREREHMEDMDEDDDRDEELEALLVCLDMLRGSSSLLRQHKAGVAGLLPSRGWKARRALERLVADLTDVLSATGATAAGSQQQHVMVSREKAAGRGGGSEASGVKRARAQQALQARSAEQRPPPPPPPPPLLLLQQQQQQQGAASVSAPSCPRADPLGLAEVVEHVMSFAEGREVLGRLSRVCRLWRRVSEGERLCVRVLQRNMPCALLGGEESLHARLGGSARRCLQVHNASLTSGRLLPATSDLMDREMVLLIEVYWGETLLNAVCGGLDGPVGRDGNDIFMYVCDIWAQSYQPFSAASLGVHNIRRMFNASRRQANHLSVRVLMMDKATGVAATLWQGPFLYEGEPQQMEDGVFLSYTSKPVPITSMTYNGPPLQAQVELFIELCEELNEGEDEEAVLSDRERRWKMCGSSNFQLMGQPSVHCEKFIRTRLAEEAMAAKQQGW